MTWDSRDAHARSNSPPTVPATGVNPRVGCILLDDEGRDHRRGLAPRRRHRRTPRWMRSASCPRAARAARPPSSPSSRATTRGHTGPCSEALIEAGVARVVYGADDPGHHSGGGAERLREAGVEVIGGVLAAEIEAFLGDWLTAARLGRPYIVVKWASSLDGRAAAIGRHQQVDHRSRRPAAGARAARGLRRDRRRHRHRARRRPQPHRARRRRRADGAPSRRPSSSAPAPSRRTPPCSSTRNPVDLRGHPRRRTRWSRDLRASAASAASTSRAARRWRARSSPPASSTSTRSTSRRRCSAATALALGDIGVEHHRRAAEAAHPRRRAARRRPAHPRRAGPSGARRAHPPPAPPTQED